jgi:D-lactate dehydrogenase
MIVQTDLVRLLREVAGKRRVLTSARATRRYRQGFRGQLGDAVAIVLPATLVALWRTLEVCTEHGAVVVFQAANTGLTGGSSPPSASDDRPVIIVSTRTLAGIHLVDEGRQAICLPGTTLHDLEKVLRPLGREPHSVIGSTCLGASVVGGVCNNSGGALVRRGPAYTEMALYAQLGADRTLRLVNALGIELGRDPEEVVGNLEAGDFSRGPVTGVASDPEYHRHVRDVTASTPARFNADPRRLHGASGSAGRIGVFATLVDTFAAEPAPVTICCGTSSAGDLASLRHALLAGETALPISAEYIHRDALDAADSHGRDLFHAIRMLGTDRIPALFAAKAWADAIGTRMGIRNAADRVLQSLGSVLPSIYTPRLRAHRQRFFHHLILKVGASEAEHVLGLVRSHLAPSGGTFFVCTPTEATFAGLHRYVTAGAAIRMQLCDPGRFGHLVAFDVALPRNALDWDEPLPTELARDVALALDYGHFVCHVFHRDYLLHPGALPEAFKARMMDWFDRRGIEFPAEHNVGRQYRAKPELEAFYRALDPTNSFNPGIGQTSSGRDWSDPAFSGEER